MPHENQGTAANSSTPTDSSSCHAATASFRAGAVKAERTPCAHPTSIQLC